KKINKGIVETQATIEALKKKNQWGQTRLICTEEMLHHHVPRLVRGIQGSRSGIGSLDPADKPRDVDVLDLPGDCDRIRVERK
ncbi:MAG: hypothetical protein NTW94_02775, partial [Legionellales bacterium]|nr:hypothetical protein [Legionellales bacterium]